MTWYSVTLDAEGPKLDDEALEELVDAVAVSHVLHGPALSARQDGPGVSVIASVETSDAAGALGRAMEGFRAAASEAGISLGGIERAEVMTEAFQERWLAEEPDSLVGISEIAALLGVSKQRVAQLRSTSGFPAPYAELAAGPVWHRSTLNLFVKGWARKPGRPRKVEVLEGAGKSAAVATVSNVRTRSGARIHDHTARLVARKAAAATTAGKMLARKERRAASRKAAKH